MTTPPASAPPVVTVQLDKPSYKLNDVVTATAEYTDSSAQGAQLVVTVTVNDPATGLQGTADATAQVTSGDTPTLPASASDNAGNSYTEQSNTAGTAVFTGTLAQAPPAA